MTVNKFAKLVAAREGKKQQLSVAQIAEVLRVVNDLTAGVLYALIKGWL